MLGLTRRPRRAVPGRPGRPHRLHHRADQRVVELADAAAADQPGGLSGLDIPADGLAVHPRQLTPTRRSPWPSSQARSTSRTSITETSR